MHVYLLFFSLSMWKSSKSVHLRLLSFTYFSSSYYLQHNFHLFFPCLFHQLCTFSFSTASCLSSVEYFNAVFYESVRNVKLWRCFIHIRAFIPLSYSHHTCCLLLPAAPGPGGDIWSFSHPTLCHRGISWDGAVDQRWPGTGWRERPPR